MQLVENSNHPLKSQGGKVLSGLFAEMGTYNQNGRMYPEDIYEQAYEELIPKIKEKRLLGELDHPMDYDEVRLSNVSHAILDCEIFEEAGVKKVYGSVELLDTPAGLIAQSLVNAGIPLGISSRGIGSTRQVRDGVEVTQLKLITYDLVADPSFANAVLSPEKASELSDSLHYIESKLPLRESVESQSIRDMIYRIRESLIERKTVPSNEINHKAEIDRLNDLLESANATIASDTAIMVESRNRIKELEAQLKESRKEYHRAIRNMHKLQDSYNELLESAPTREQLTELQDKLIESQKQLAVEKRGMAFGKVSELLEGATTTEDIENRLNSLTSISRKRQTPVVLPTLTESKDPKKLTGLASIVSRV